MGTFRAATQEVHTTASGWHTLAGELTSTAPTVSGLSFQPSAAAVTAVHAWVAASSGVLMERTVMTAAKAAAAATAYTENNATSAAKLNALTGAL